jgi:cytidylate kinase
MTVVVAIDGPAGSGKSTLARRLALELGLPYVNTGLMYRALALVAARSRTDPDDGAALSALARGLTFDLDHTRVPPSLTIDGQTPGDELEGPNVESIVSRVARHPEVRAILRDRQRALISAGAVVEGRDIGTVVAPEATVKLYLDAAEDARVGRRAAQRSSPPPAVGDELVRRDHADARTNPFIPSPDAVVIDTTGLRRDEVFRTALSVIRERGRS